jgi:hypothetical protein
MKTIVDRLYKAGFVLFDARPFPCVVLPYDISNAKHVKTIRRLLPDAIQDDMTTNNGLCSTATVDGFNLVLVGVRMQHDDRYSILAHETYHAVNFIYKQCGAYHDIENDEHTAYFIQDTYRQALAALEGYAQ